MDTYLSCVYIIAFCILWGYLLLCQLIFWYVFIQWNWMVIAMIAWSKYFWIYHPKVVLRNATKKWVLLDFQKIPTAVLRRKKKEAVQFYQLNGQTGLIFHGLISSIIWFTHEQLKAYKSLEGYNFYVKKTAHVIRIITMCIP